MHHRRPFNPREPFPRFRALQAGLPRATVDSPAFRRLLHGIIVDADVPDSAVLRVKAALACYFDSAHASHASAARVWRVPVQTRPGEHVTVPDEGHRLRRTGVTTHHRADAATVVRDGVRVSVLVDLFVELAEELSLVELVVAGDWMVRRQGVRLKDLRRVAMRATGPTARLARKAALHVRAGVDSPMESRLRMLIVLAGLPEPVVNATVRDVDGEVVRRFDLSWPDVRVIVEYDGRHHVERVEQWEADLDRREEIDDEGWRILVVVASGIYTDPARTVRRIFHLLRARGLEGLPDWPSEDWRPHFPGRLAA
ncbi:DUF559 domain-containing protein [Nocardioides glacieisoli]|uniref:DUF559 domain-containing protein n=1 Tax=Nocardioides glacieisoli TaxID=1168730 RepID=A0A4Q2RN31_9ACTN|nr:DUF559 domain-containing protein [Nocardioides glacieisoli]RYB90260.1 DUF559 domain-containing protein [Nocardioides glacieisoli]